MSMLVQLLVRIRSKNKKRKKKKKKAKTNKATSTTPPATTNSAASDDDGCDLLDSFLTVKTSSSEDHYHIVPRNQANASSSSVYTASAIVPASEPDDEFDPRMLDMARQTASSYNDLEHTISLATKKRIHNDKDIPWRRVIGTEDEPKAKEAHDKELASMESYGFEQITAEKHGKDYFQQALLKADKGREILAKKRPDKNGNARWKGRIVKQGHLSKSGPDINTFSPVAGLNAFRALVLRPNRNVRHSSAVKLPC